MRSRSPDRFLFGIFVGIGVLVLAALVLFFTRQSNDYGSESSPAGVLHNYILAIQKKDYQRAYRYLAADSSLNFSLFQQSFMAYPSSALDNTTVEIGTTTLDEQNQTALVQLTLLSSSPDLFGDFSRRTEVASLIFQDGSWKILSVPYPYQGPNMPLPAPNKVPPRQLPSPTPTEAP